MGDSYVTGVVVIASQHKLAKRAYCHHHQTQIDEDNRKIWEYTASHNPLFGNPWTWEHRELAQR
jgi:hypothetical protein